MPPWAGMWIAVKDGKVIAAAYNSRDLVPAVRKLGEAGHGAVAQFVPPRTISRSSSMQGMPGRRGSLSCRAQNFRCHFKACLGLRAFSTNLQLHSTIL